MAPSGALKTPRFKVVLQGESIKGMGIQPPNHSAKPVFLLGFHRGCSTFMQRLLNCHDDLVVWGEHAGIFHDFALMTERFGSSAIQKIDVEKYQDFTTYTKEFIPWANPVSIKEFKVFAAAKIDELFSAGGQIPRWGIKEIRYNNAHALGFMADLFPQAKFLFLTRDPVAMYSSALNARWGKLQQEDEIRQNAQHYYARYRKQLTDMQAFQRDHPDTAMIVAVEDITSETLPWNDVLQFLELDPAGVRQDLVDEVRGAVAGSSYQDAGKDTDPEIIQQSIAALKQIVEEGDAAALGEASARDPEDPIASLEADLRDAKVELKATQRQLRVANRKLGQMSRSTSWRLMSPLRSFKALISPQNDSS